MGKGKACPSYPRAARRRRPPPVERGMGPLGVVEVDPLDLHRTSVALAQVRGGLPARAERRLQSRIGSSAVVHAPAPAIHGDRNAGVFEHAGEVEASKLAALIGIEDRSPDCHTRPAPSLLWRSARPAGPDEGVRALSGPLRRSVPGWGNHWGRRRSNKAICVT